ncbi:MAG: hypothetical protein EHM61_19760 [Acidobacteria bacterium]|nr:MAG: hypothetical protein EHM61_19760 [Acidobacteriota bacterium]
MRRLFDYKASITTVRVLTLEVCLILASLAVFAHAQSWNRMDSGVTHDLNDVWGSSASDVFAVGMTWRGDRYEGTVMHYDGAAWSSMPGFAGGSSLYGVWGSSGSDVFAVGDLGTILHYDGQNWSRMDSGTTHNLRDVWGTAGNDVFAVGGTYHWTGHPGYYHSAILHYDGVTWKQVFERGATGGGSPVAVWGSSGRDVFVVGMEGTILHYDGTDWGQITTQARWLFGVWGSSSSDVFAVGDRILHNDGVVWSEMPRLDENTYLHAVWASDGGEVFAVGDAGTILHFDGVAWRPMNSGSTHRLSSVWGSAGGDVFAVGDYGTILHYGGPPWSQMDSGTTRQLYDVWGSAGSDVFAVGGGYRKDGTILHYDGTGWSQMASFENVALHGVWGSSGNDVFAVGDQGAIFHYNGETWTRMESSVTHDLYDVWGSSGNDVFAVGGTYHWIGPGQPVYYESVILHCDGVVWRQVWTQATGPGVPNTVWGSSSRDVFVVGTEGMILHYDGAAWRWMTTSSYFLRGVWGSSSSDVFAVGDRILHYDGAIWTEMAVGYPCRYGVWGSGARDVLMVGTEGMILHYNGVVWSQMSSSPNATLRSVWGSWGGDVFAVGEAGTILHYFVSDCPPQASVASGPGSVAAGQSYSISWTDTSPENVYLVEEATNDRFARAQSWVVNGTSRSFVHADAGTYYYRVLARVRCSGAETDSPWSNVAQTEIRPAGTLVLRDNRFTVAVNWRTAEGSSGEGVAVGVSGDSGYFWFFGPENVEVFVKLLDGRAVNGYFWFFYGALTNIQYTLIVTDTQTGNVRTYYNLQGVQAGGHDIYAFPGSTSSYSLFPDSLEGLPHLGGPAFYAQDRFSIEVSWTTPGGASGSGTAMPLTSDSGYFWFFDGSNVELVVKMVDGRGVNSHFWFFYGSLTDIQFTITVTDTTTGATRSYHGQQGVQQSGYDLNAF